MRQLDERRVQSNGAVRYRPRHRPGLGDRLLVAILLVAMVTVVVVGVAIVLGSVWLSVVFAQDIMRRLGG